MNTYTLDWKKYSETARAAVAEGCVLLRNESDALPIREGETAAVFGRIQLDYYKSGTGSGGMVNVPYVHSILDGLAQHPSVRIYEPLLDTYRAWTAEHPFDCGTGWGTEPWCQEEMPLSDELTADAAAHADLALVIIGRTAGEDRDNTPQPGSYYLTDAERDMLKKVCGAFPRTAVVLNTGNIIDMSWVEEYAPQAVLYVWQGGMEGGSGAADVLCGTVSPSGKLPDTIARDLQDYPSIRNFGSEEANFYQEDVYVGYRYFETFAPQRVLYPFGFGLSYTSFEIDAALTIEDLAGISSEQNEAGTVSPHDNASGTAQSLSAATCRITAAVTNTGSVPGKEVVQVYACPPQGLLGKPVRNLYAFAKTDVLQPGETQTLTFTVPVADLASYDDSGATGNKACFVLEAGEYGLYTGTDVHSASPTGSFSIPETVVVARYEEALAPVRAFERFRPAHSEQADQSGTFALAYEPVPLRTISPADRRAAQWLAASEYTDNAVNQTDAARNTQQLSAPEYIGDAVNQTDAARLSTSEYTGDRGYKLADVLSGAVTMEQFLAQLSDSDLTMIVRGEGMCSPKVTPGTAAAFGGVTDSLQHFGIPAGCCSDGPSGIRMDCGTSAFSLPNGTLLASTFNTELVTQLFEFEGLELYANQIDSLLGPGINIHRSPLNGRNFEYLSEDPCLTGQIAAAQLAGMDRFGISGTVKHFCANNQEYHRYSVDSIVSERALREIYLKPFEISVRSGHTRSVMTTYGPVNGLWTAGSFDLNTTILRGDWGYRGMVMTDWWAQMNDEGQSPSLKNLAAMVRAQNDVFMVTPDAASYEDNLTEALAEGTLTRAELVRCAANICSFLLASPAMQRMTGTYTPVEHVNQPDELSLLDPQDLTYHEIADESVIDLESYRTDGSSSFLIGLSLLKEGVYDFALTASCEGSELAQMTVTLSLDGTVINVCSFHGNSNKPLTLSCEKEIRGTTHYLKFYFAQSGLKLHSLRITLLPEQKLHRE